MGQETNETEPPKQTAPPTGNQEMAASTSGPKKKDCCASFGKFMYDRETGEFMGRRPVNWCKLLLFYLIFWGILAGYFAAFYELFYCQISLKLPRLVGEQSLMKDSSRSVATPGMGFMPMPDNGNSVIRFTAGPNNETYKEYVENLNEYLERYTNLTALPAGRQCGPDGKATDDTFCFFDIKQLEECGYGTNYGYDEGAPCVMLRLNKMISFVPKPIICQSEKSCLGLSEKDIEFFNREARPDVPITQVFDGKSLVFTCEGITPADRENIASVEWFPSGGSIPISYFPYMNQQNYTAPLVMAKFNVTPGILILIRCRAWAQNILNSNFLAREGAVHFELMADIYGSDQE